jgi:hypothetical protein
METQYVVGRKPVRKQVSSSTLLHESSHARKRSFSPVQSPSISYPLKSPPNEGVPPEEHEDEVDSTSECDSEYSIPPAKRPGISNFLSDRRDSEEKVDDSNVFGSLKSLTSEIENKYKSVLSENQKLRHKVPILEKENRDLKNTKRELEAKRVAEWSNYSRAIEKMKDSLKEAQDTIANQKRQLLDKDTQLKKEQIENVRLKRNVQGLLKTFQSALDDTYREENWKDTVTWFDGYRDYDLPEVKMVFLMDFLQELTSIWEELGIALGVEGKVAVERTSTTTEDRKCLHVLQKWSTLTTASWPGLLDVLVKLNKRQLAVQIETKVLEEVDE